MTNDTLIKLAAQWERNATGYERRNASINRSACHDDKRALNTGLAAGMRAAADQLRALVANTKQPATVEVTTIDSPVPHYIDSE